ncbi:MAG: HU family DNA-binding protein [Bacteroidales bacterium]|nr:HU family DNA-binding protein [Bacteroidales bacterium]
MNNRYVLSDLVDALVKAGHKRRDAEEFARVFFAQIEEQVFRGDTVKIKGLGLFRLILSGARESVNVNTGERIKIDEHYKLQFLPEAGLKEMVNVPYAHLDPIPLDDETAAALAAKTDAVSDEPAGDTKPEVAPAKEAPVFEVEESQPSENQKSDKKGTTIAWIIFVLLALALIVYALCSTVFSGDNRNARRTRPVVRNEVVTEVPAAPAAEQAEAVQTAEQAPAAQLAEKPQAADKQAPAAAKPSEAAAPKTAQTAQQVADKAAAAVDASKWEVQREITLGQGERLTLVAQQYYGDKVYWVYLYQANRDRIPNPNKITAGTKIRIPKAPASVVNPKDPASLQKAAALEEAYRKQFASKK